MADFTEQEEEQLNSTITIVPSSPSSLSASSSDLETESSVSTLMGNSVTLRTLMGDLSPNPYRSLREPLPPFPAENPNSCNADFNLRSRSSRSSFENIHHHQHKPRQLWSRMRACSNYTVDSVYKAVDCSKLLPPGPWLSFADSDRKKAEKLAKYGLDRPKIYTNMVFEDRAEESTLAGTVSVAAAAVLSPEIIQRTIPAPGNKLCTENVYMNIMYDDDLSDSVTAFTGDRDSNYGSSRVADSAGDYDKHGSAGVGANFSSDSKHGSATIGRDDKYGSAGVGAFIRSRRTEISGRSVHGNRKSSGADGKNGVVVIDYYDDLKSAIKYTCLNDVNNNSCQPARRKFLLYELLNLETEEYLSR